MEIKMEIKGLDAVTAALRKMGQRAAPYFQAAGGESAEEIIQTPGLGIYPAAGPGNSPPTPYYVRGQGTQYLRGNDGRSEKLGTQFFTDYHSNGLTIGNRASYADWVIGERQARHMAAIGWQPLHVVAQQKLSRIVAIYQKWLDKLVKDAGL